MRRRTFDLIASLAGLALAVVLLVTAVLFKQNADFAKDNVKEQLTAQHIFFAPEEALSEAEKDQPGVVKYAGQQVTTGEMARVYADEYIGLHLRESLDGKTYSELSNESRENPEDEEAAAKVQTAFRGETLRGILLTSYAFGEMGEKAQEMAVVFFIAAGVFLILALLGFWHHARTPREVQLDL